MMGKVQKLHHRWEFRRRDGYFDSSNDELASSSSSQPGLEKHKPVSSFALPKTNGANAVGRFQRKSKYAPVPREHLQVEKSSKMKIGDKEDGPTYGEMRNGNSGIEFNEKNDNGKICEPATLDDTRLLMESILEELKIARENMLIQMRKEVQKWMDEDTDPESTARTNSYEHEIIAEHHLDIFNDNPDCNTRILGGSIKRKNPVYFHISDEVLENQDERCQMIEPIPSLAKPETVLKSSVEGRPSYSVSPSNQVSSSMYLTLPMVLPKDHATNQRFDSPSSNYFSTRAVGKQIMANIGKANTTLDSSICSVTSPEGQNEEKLQNVASTGSLNLTYVSQSKLAPAPSFGSGFPVPFRHGFKIQAQAGIQNSLGLQGNTPGMSTKRGISPFTEGHSLSELFGHYNLCNHANYEGNFDTWASGNLIRGTERGLIMQELLYQEGLHR